MQISMQSLWTILRWFNETDEEDIQPQLESLFTRGAPSKQTPPDHPGIYRFINKNTGQLTYIGVSIQLLTRMRWHHRYTYSKEEYDFAWKAVNRIGNITPEEHQLLRAIEQRQIAKHRPRDNRNRGGGGRNPQW